MSKPLPSLGELIVQTPTKKDPKEQIIENLIILFCCSGDEINEENIKNCFESVPLDPTPFMKLDTALENKEKIIKNLVDEYFLPVLTPEDVDNLEVRPVSPPRAPTSEHPVEQARKPQTQTQPIEALKTSLLPGRGRGYDSDSGDEV